MKGGDLSNEPARAVGVRFENLLKVDGKLNVAAKRMIEKFYSDTEVNLFIFTYDDRRKVMSFCYKWNIPYTSVFDVDSPLEIPRICKEHHILLYIDVDTAVIEDVEKIPNCRGELFTRVEF